MNRILYTLFILCIPAISAADNHELRMLDLGIGSTLVYRADDGEVTTTSLVGTEGEHFITEIRAGDDGKGALESRLIVDSRGQRVRREAGRTVYRYEPHFCYRTMGRCTFKFTNEDTGFSARIERFTERDGPNRFSYEMYLQGRSGSQLVESGWFETGEYGVISKYHFSGTSSSETGELIEIRLPKN